MSAEEAVRQQSQIDIWKLFQIASPIVAIIGFIVYMQADVGQTLAKVATLERHGENVGQILTAHTTQIAVNTNDIAANRNNSAKLDATLRRVEDKLDRLLLQEKGAK